MYNWSIIGFVKRVKKSFSIIVATVGVASFLDLTKKKKKKKRDLQIAISKKIHKFLVFLRKLKDKNLRKSKQMKKSFSIIVTTIGVV